MNNFEFRFDHNWFDNHTTNLSRILLFDGYDKLPRSWRILEIGAFEGMSTTWFLKNDPRCRVTTIDTWMGGADHDPNNPQINFKKVKENFDHNISPFKDRLEVIQSNSFDALIYLIQQKRKYDFVYVDGSHTAKDVNLDLILAFKLLEPKAVIYCDDYYWGFNEENVSVYDAPKLGIDSFVNVYADKLRPMTNLTNDGFVILKVAE